MRLIDASRAIGRVEEIPILTDKNKAFYEGCRYMQKRVLSIFHTSKTIDAAPVVHGRWEHDSVGYDDFWRCSACREDWFFECDPEAENARVNYCPSCGAKMDGGKDETD